jgi:cytochrome c2
MRAAITLAFLLLAGPAFAAGTTGDATAGHSDFNRCSACHTTTAGRNGLGPSLAGVVGRTSGTAAGYHYSPAMTNAHLTWDTATLDHFLTNPQAAVHGTRMFITVPDAKTRQDIIAYLATLH